ncbi:hypothetical protein ACFC8N_42940 [Streptomyces sp. NPDC055966]|uniref:hypothetical protein n=1 Tax=Streptomyces sp. NPDC055966 TaxID=3345669 RepID=UPI0035DD3BEC
MGFLSAYSDTRKIDLGGGYWVEIKECLSIVEKQRAEKALSSGPVFDQNGRGSAQMDMPAFHTEMVVASITAWNLDEDDGTVWPLTPEPVKRKNVARLPASVFDQIFKEVDELNGPKPARERAQFPEPGLGGDPDGHGGATEPGDVLGGAAAVAAPGAAPSGPGDPSVA